MKKRHFQQYLIRFLVILVIGLGVNTVIAIDQLPISNLMASSWGEWTIVDSKDDPETTVEDKSLVAEDGQSPVNPSGTTSQVTKPKTILINFNNVTITEYIRFISKITNKNFVFDDNDLRFNVTIVSEEPTTIDHIMSALLQVLRIHGLTLIEEGNNLIIHKTPGVNSISTIVSGNDEMPPNAEIVTRLFRLNTVDPDKAATIIRPLVSTSAIVEVFKATNYVIVTDLSSNIIQIEKLLKSIDAPNSGLSIGQYVVRNGYIDSLIQIAERIMKPISQDQPLIFVPHRAANSIFIVANPFLMERTISILQYIDQNQGQTRIFDLKDLKYNPELFNETPGAGAAAGGATGLGPLSTRPGGWQVDSAGNWIYRPLLQPGLPASDIPPQGQWYVDEQGNWRFQSGAKPTSPTGLAGVSVGPEGQWKLDSQGIWVFQLAPGKSISPERIVRPQRGMAELPVGHIERTQFYIYKLRYRKGDQIQQALGKIGQSLRLSGTANADLISTIDSSQYIEASNSMIFTGTSESLLKIKELMSEVDAPLRQVFIEMLILDTTITDSLTFGVNWATKSGGAQTASAQSFLTAGSPLPIAMATVGINATTGIVNTPNASSLAIQPGFNQGIIGQRITHGGTQFSALGALVQALHTRKDSKVLLNPKILTEDNYPAEIFVGINTQFPTQAIANDQGSIITQNFEFRDVGTRLKVTPLISDNDMITLIIQEEVSALTTIQTNTPQSGPTTSKSTTTTKVHMPNDFFLVMSGMIQDEDDFTRNQMPCLGGLPFIGVGFGDRSRTDNRRALMIFIRPTIIETDEEVDNITKHQQDVWNYKNRLKKSWEYEVDEMFDQLNLPKPSEEPYREQACEPCYWQG